MKQEVPLAEYIPDWSFQAKTKRECENKNSVGIHPVFNQYSVFFCSSELKIKDVHM